MASVRRALKSMTSYRFGAKPAFELQVRERRLFADGEPVHLGSRALDVLIVLVERAGQVVSRRELIERVWPEVAVEENNLNVQVSGLRKAIGSHLIATIPGRGYCFVSRSSVSPIADTAEGPARLRTNLPATLTRLIGRDSELVELESLVSAHRIVTLVGPGGVGKTLLAQHLLLQHQARFRHGVCFVELSALTDTSGIPGAIASALRIQPNGEALASLAGAVESLEILVVLDGAEHLLAGVSSVVLALHDAAPGLKMVVTSQAPLKLAAERVHRVSSLRVPDEHLSADEAVMYGAVALFVERAQSVDSRFFLSDADASAAIDLCRVLDGLPLAIELAAWRAPVLGVRRLADSMDEPLRLLTAKNVGVPSRQQTLRQALQWSHGLLETREQVVLRRFSVLVGSSDLDLVRQVTSDAARDGQIDEWAVVDALSTLVERSLVSVVPGSKADLTYRLLDTPRSFAKEQLVAAGELEQIGRRHASAMAERFCRAHAERFSGGVALGVWQERHLVEVDNGHEALVWARKHNEPELALRLLPGLMLATPREQSTKQAEMLALSSELVRQAKRSWHVLWTLLEASHMAMFSDPLRAQLLANQAVDVASQCDDLLEDRRWLYRALCQRAMALLKLAETDSGEKSLSEARALERADWPPVIGMQRWQTEVWLADRLGDGEAMYRASLRFHSLSREAGLPEWFVGLSMVNGALAGGRADEAVQFGLAALTQLEGTRHLGVLAGTRIQLAGAFLEAGRLDEAREQSLAAWPLMARFSRIDAWADYQALLAAMESRPGDAALLMGFADAACARGNVVRTRNEAAAVKRTMDLLRANLEAPELDRLIAMGKQLLLQDIPRVAFGPRVLWPDLQADAAAQTRRTGHGGA